MNSIVSSTDFNDLQIICGSEAVEQQLAAARAPKQLTAYTLHSFLAMDIPPQEMLLAPIIAKQGLAMLYAYRGVGKTHVALNIAYAAASGGAFLKWRAPKPSRVLYIDGEMPAKAMQERLAVIVNSHDTELPSEDYLNIITPDYQELGIPSLSTLDGQAALENHLDGIELLIVDNISTLCRGGKENDAESWIPVQEWALSLRKRGISVLFVHHAGKSGQQRGTTKREDTLDTVISLRHPSDYDPTEGARFEVHYEKTRNISGDEANSFEAKLVIKDGISTWEVHDLRDARKLEIIRLNKEGMSYREIAADVSLSKSAVAKIIKQAKEDDSYYDIT